MKKNVDISATDLPRRLRKLRRLLGLSKQELADRAHLTSPAIHDIESGKTKQVLETTLNSLAKELGVTTEELLRGQDPPRPLVDRPARRRRLWTIALLVSLLVLAAALWGIRELVL